LKQHHRLLSNQLFTDSNAKRIHFIAVCGVAMASVAAELHHAGFDVTGSDTGFYPPMGDFLREQGLKTLEGFDPDHLPEDGLIVVGNAVSRGNPELEAALDRGLPLISLPELIARRYLASQAGTLALPCIRRSVVVTGTHGKTTITTMLAHILREAGHNPGWLVGGIPLDLPVPCYFGQGGEFVIEGDEYDVVYYDKRPKFLHYRPYYAVLNSVEFDHADIYPDLNAIELQFRRFVRLIPKSGCLIVYGDNQLAMSIAENALCKVVTFGTRAKCDWQLTDYEFTSSQVCMFTSSKIRSAKNLELTMLGKHNYLNALAAIATAYELGVNVTDAIEAMLNFRGVARRLELVIQAGVDCCQPSVIDSSGDTTERTVNRIGLTADKGGLTAENEGLTAENTITLYDDFAHHPTAIKATLSAVRQGHPDQRIWALFEPRSNTMVRRIFINELIDALQLADHVILGPIHRADSIPYENRLNRDEIIHELQTCGVNAYAGKEINDIVQYIQDNIEPNDVIVIMSNGSFGGMRDRLKEVIKLTS